MHGFFKDQTRIIYEEKSIIGAYCDLEFRNLGDISADPFIRLAVATYAGHNFTRLTGISGAPVFDETANRLCGMVTRAGLKDGAARMWYIDIFHIVKTLEAINANATTVSYALV